MNKQIRLNNSNVKTNINKVLVDFLQEKRNVHNASLQTIQTYKMSSERLINVLNLKYAEDISSKTFNDFILELKLQSKVKDITINSYLHNISVFITYLKEHEYIDENIKIHYIHADKTIKETYTDKEIEKIIQKPNLKSCSYTELRNWVIVCFLLGTGVRARTLRNIIVKDIDFDNDMIFLRITKTRKQYLIPLATSLKSVLKTWLQHRQHDNENDYLFGTVYNTQMSSRTLTDAVQHNNNSKGVDRFGIHMFRHTFAKNWILNGGDMFRLQKILGHTSLEMVKEYVNMFAKDLAINFDEYNPYEQFQARSKPKKRIKL